MPEVVVSFLDGEVLYGELPRLHMDDPFVDLDLHTLDGNARQALVPVNGVRQIDLTTVDQPGRELDLKELARVALHFIDGQVTRAHVVSPASLQRFGAIWDVIDAGSREHKICAIPYTALKGAFYVRRWDTRSPVERTRSVGPGPPEQRRHLAEIQARRSRERMLRHLPRTPTVLLDRVQQEPGGSTRRPRPGKRPAPGNPEPKDS
ncbi:MAG: hypothetical protein ACREN1_05980 [Candidatus Dormibacteria bacterium]